MPSSNYRTPSRCTYIKVTGHRCGSPALRGEHLCYFHRRMVKEVPNRSDCRLYANYLILDSEEAIQVALMEIIHKILAGSLDNKRAALVIKALYIAQRNCRYARFDFRTDDMVRELPDFDGHIYHETERRKAEERAIMEAYEKRQRKAREQAEREQAELKKAARKLAHEFDEQPAETMTAHAQTPAAPMREPSTQSNPDPAIPTATPTVAQKSKPGSSDGSQHQPTPHKARDIQTQPSTLTATCASPKKPSTSEKKAKSSEKKPTSSKASTSAKPSASPHSSPRDVSMPLTSRQTQQWKEIKRVESSLDRALHGSLSDTKAVLSMAGIFTPKERK